MMSSCSNTAHALQGAASEPADRSPLLRLVGAVADELSGFALDITVLGDSLASTATALGTVDAVRDIQTFDALAQRARAYTAILRELAQDSDKSEEERRYEIELLIGTLPFADLRRRLVDALDGNRSPDPLSDLGAETTSHVHWFD